MLIVINTLKGLEQYRKNDSSYEFYDSIIVTFDLKTPNDIISTADITVLGTLTCAYVNCRNLCCATIDCCDLDIEESIIANEMNVGRAEAKEIIIHHNNGNKNIDCQYYTDGRNCTCI